jgi:hypothetical protein
MVLCKRACLWFSTTRELSQQDSSTRTPPPGGNHGRLPRKSGNRGCGIRHLPTEAFFRQVSGFSTADIDSRGAGFRPDAGRSRDIPYNAPYTLGFAGPTSAGQRDID